MDKLTFGKGYRAFLNTIVALTFMEYLSQHGTLSPGLLVIDSPILSSKKEAMNKHLIAWSYPYLSIRKLK